MSDFVIKGPAKLKGTILVSGAKNAVLPIMAAAAMADSPCILHNAPRLLDVEIMADILCDLGLKVEREGTTLIIDPGGFRSFAVDEALMRKVRSSIFLMGPILGKIGEVQVSYPGGCDIGQRPIDLHLKGLKTLGAFIKEEHGQIFARGSRLFGADMHLDIPSVGATENIMMAASLAEGFTVIRNAAKEPEIVDLQNFLVAMGAKIKGAGTDVIRVLGVKNLSGAEYSIMPDRIEVGTMMAAAAITGGDVSIENAVSEHVQAVTSKLRETGAYVRVDKGVRVVMENRPKAIDLKTLPYPGFPTDMQPQMMALLSLADGASVINETIFDSRFKQAEELVRMGAKIRTESRTAIIKGVEKLSGARVLASDLRSGAALVLAGLAAQGETVVSNMHNVDRGYEMLEGKLEALGADVLRADDFKVPKASAR